jgi:hypothetical protein
MKNQNCLEGFRCPSCGYEGDFLIESKTMFRVTDDGAEQQGDVGWSDSSLCICGKCPHHGTVEEFTRPPIPSDPEGMNDDRAKWAHDALERFCAVTGQRLPEDNLEALLDLLCDLRHWCDRHQVDYSRADRNAQCHYDEEIGLEGGEV